MDWKEFFIPTLDNRVKEQRLDLEKENTRHQKLTNDAEELSQMRDKGLALVNQIDTLHELGDIDGVERAMKKMATVMPDGEEYTRTDTDPATGKKRMVFTDQTNGGESFVDLTFDGIRDTNEVFRSKFSDPAELDKERQKGRQAILDANNKSEFAPLDDNQDYRALFNEKTGKRYYEIRDNKSGKIATSETLPRTLKQTQGLQTDKLAVDKAGLENEDIKAGIKLKGGQTAAAYANADKDRAQAEYTREYKPNGGRSAKDDKYDKDFTEAMQKKYGLTLNSRDKKGNIIPQVFDDNSITSMAGFAQTNGYELLARKTDNGYEVYDYRRIEQAQPAPKPSGPKAQPPKQAPKQSQYKSLNDRKAANFASQYLNSGDAGRKIVMDTVLKAYGPAAWKTVQSEIGRLNKEKADGAKKDVFLQWGDKEYYIPTQGKV